MQIKSSKTAAHQIQFSFGLLWRVSSRITSHVAVYCLLILNNGNCTSVRCWETAHHSPTAICDYCGVKSAWGSSICWLSPSVQDNCTWQSSLRDGYEYLCTEEDEWAVFECVNYQSLLLEYSLTFSLDDYILLVKFVHGFFSLLLLCMVCFDLCILISSEGITYFSLQVQYISSISHSWSVRKSNVS